MVVSRDGSAVLLSRAMEAEEEDNRRATGTLLGIIFPSELPTYARSTMQTPRDRYAVYFLRDLDDPPPGVPSLSEDAAQGRWRMPGWS